MNLTADALLFDFGGTLDTDGLHWSHLLWQGYCVAGLGGVGEPLFREAYVQGERTLATEPVIESDDTFYRLLFKKVTIELQFLAARGIAPLAREQQRHAAAHRVAAYCYGYMQRNMAATRRVLSACRSVCPMALVTNFYGNMRCVLGEFGLDGYFAVVAESAVEGVRKPSPRLFSLALERLGVPASGAVVVGDSLSKDVQPALSLGCRAVWLRGRGWDDAALPVPAPAGVRVIASLAELCG